MIAFEGDRGEKGRYFEERRENIKESFASVKGEPRTKPVDERT